MAISFVAAGAVSTGANSTVGVPAGLQAFDLLLIVTTGTATPSTPSGWTQVAAQGAGQFISVFYKITTTGTESSVTLTQTGSTSKSVMLAYRGCGSYDVVGTFTNPTGTTVTAQSQTTRLANDFVLCVYGNVSGGARTWTAPGSTTTRLNSSTTSTVTGMLIVDETKATAGATTARTATISTSSALSGVQISIREPQTLYWTGTGNWSSTTLWKTSSGGATTIGAPTQNDNVVFDSNGTSCTIGSASACTNFTVAGTFAGTIAGTSTLAIAGSYVEDVSGGFTWSYSGSVTFNATTTGKTLTTNVGNLVAFLNNNITFNGLGGGWTIGGQLGGSTKTLTLTAGALDLNDNYLGFTTFTASGSAVRSLNSGPTQIGTIGLLANSGTVVTLNGTNITVTGSITYSCQVPTVSASARTIDLNSVYTESNAPSLELYNSNDTPTLTAPIVKNLSFYDTGTGTSTISNSAITIYGQLYINNAARFTFSAGTNAWTFAATSGDPSSGAGWYIATSGETLDFPITFDGVGGSWRLFDALTVGSTRTVTLTNGTLNLNNNNLTCGLFASNNSNTRTLTSGTGQFYLTGNNNTIWNTNQASGLTYTDTPTVNATYSGATGTRSIINCSVNGNIGTHPINYNVTAGSDLLTTSAVTLLKNVNFTGYTGTGASSIIGFVTGNMTFASGMSSSSAGTLYLANQSAITQTITSNGITVDTPMSFGYRTGTISNAVGDGTTATITFPTSTSVVYPVGATIVVTNIVPTGYNGTYTVTASTTTTISYACTETGTFVSGGNASLGLSTVTLNGALTLGSTRTVILASGTLNLNNANLTCNAFSSTVDGVRKITTTTGQIYCVNSTGGGVVSLNPAVNYTSTGDVIFNLTGASTAQRTMNYGSVGGSETYAPSIVVANGSDAFNIAYQSHVRNVTLTSGFTGAPLLRGYIYGNLSIANTLSGWTTDATNPVWFASTSATTRTIDTNGQTINQNIQFVGVGGSWKLLSDLVNTQSYIRFLNGTFDANGFNVTCNAVQSPYTTTRSIIMGTGTWTLNGSGSVWSTSPNTNLTFSGASATIVLQDNSTTARTFTSGTGLVHGNLVFSGSNIVQTTFTGGQTWNTWSSTKTTAFTITISTGTTVTLSNWTISGTAGNLVTLNSSTAGTRATLSKSSGTVNVSYMDIKDSNAQGGATWNAFTSNGNVDSGNNLGWIFSGGGTAYFQNVNYTSTSVFVYTNQVNKQVSIVEASTEVLTKDVRKPIALTETSTVTVKKGMFKSLISTVSSIVSLVATKVKQLLLTLTSTTTASIRKAINTTKTITSTSTASIKKAVSIIKSITSTILATLITAKGRFVILTINSPSIVLITKRVNKLLTKTVTSITSIIKLGNKTLLATVSNTVTLLRKLTLSKLISTTVSNTTSMLKKVLKTFTLLSTSVSSISKVVKVIKTIVESLIVTLIPSRFYTRTLTILSTTTAVLVKVQLKVLAIITTSITSISKALTKSLETIQTILVTVIKSVTKTLTSTVNLTVILLSAKTTVIALITTAVTSVTSLIKQTGKVIAPIVNSISSINKAIFKLVIANVISTFQLVAEFVLKYGAVAKDTFIVQPRDRLIKVVKSTEVLVRDSKRSMSIIKSRIILLFRNPNGR